MRVCVCACVRIEKRLRVVPEGEFVLNPLMKESELSEGWGSKRER